MFYHVYLILQNLARNSSKEQDFRYEAARSSRNQNKNRFQEFLPRMKNINFVLLDLIVVDIADTARVIIPRLDGHSDYINFCYIDVSIYLCSYLYNT